MARPSLYPRLYPGSCPSHSLVCISVSILVCTLDYIQPPASPSTQVNEQVWFITGTAAKCKTIQSAGDICNLVRYCRKRMHTKQRQAQAPELHGSFTTSITGPLGKIFVQHHALITILSNMNYTSKRHEHTQLTSANNGEIKSASPTTQVNEQVWLIHGTAPFC